MVTEENKLSKIIVVGDRVLIKPKTPTDKTKSGLFLPPGVHEKEKIQSGYVIKVGPGYPLPPPSDEMDEPWKANNEKLKYMPLQVEEGDLAIFLQKGAFEVIYEGEKYFIVPQHTILMVERDPELFS
ncbi:co-chaperone GroES [Flexithrix dorotheae]|uniref:co-chaperone GroES n=1 Tax=Flexithrix dorotheae TaxID=70993 RepID=UPI000361C065|nr:co-chaperone GroES family protein [Flexithrix dorotheae]